MSVYRSTYHYGNLRAALTDAAVDLARRGGPAAVTVRGVARSVGVTPPAAYRHFAELEELLTATKDRALALLADRIDAEVEGPAAADTPIRGPVARLRAVAEAYAGFARASPGLFAMACHGGCAAIRLLVGERLGPSLNALSARRPGVVFVLWSAVHALAVLAAEEAAREVAPDVSPDEVLDTVLGWIAGDARDPGDLTAVASHPDRQSGVR
jgi:AcrR family transcriptional regulator